MLPDAPPRLSTMICCPSGLPRSVSSNRATRSTLPPAENGAMMRTGFVGYSAAKAGAAATARNTSATRRLISATPERTLIDDYRRHAVAAVIAAMPVMSAVAAEAYPAKPVRLLVGIAPGGATDVQARWFAQKLTTALGRPFVVD